MEQPPHAMLLGDDETDYYRGTLKSSPVAQTGTTPHADGEAQ
jgi:hypothetical protein